MWHGAFVCIFNKDFSKILLLKRNIEKKRREGKIWETEAAWGNIGGSIEANETPKRACIREAYEEIGIRLKPNDLVQVYIKKKQSSKPNPYTEYFYATAIDEGTKFSLNDESYKYKWFSVEKLPLKMLDKKEDILLWRSVSKRLFRINPISPSQPSKTNQHQYRVPDN